jgi:hypothetical protein
MSLFYPLDMQKTLFMQAYKKGRGGIQNSALRHFHRIDINFGRIVRYLDDLARKGALVASAS